MVLRTKKEYQATFISSNCVYKKLIPDDDYFSKIDKEFDFDFIYDELKKFYCENNGRPAKDPIQMFKACLVQRLKGLTDPEMESAARYDIRIKHFLKISIDDYGFDYSTIWVFRERLGSKTFEVIFNKLLSQIVDKGIIKNPGQQYIDSMPVLSQAALPSVTCLIYMAIKEVVKSLNNTIGSEIFNLTELNDNKLIYYSKPRPIFRKDKKEKMKAFEKGVSRARIIISYLDKKEISNEEIELLKQILNENVNHNDERIQTEKPIKTLTDKDAKLGHKTKEDLIFGYKNHSLVSDEGIITAVEISSAAERDDKHFEQLVKKAKDNNLKPEEVDGDSAYGFIETFKTAESLNVVLNAKFRGVSINDLSIYELRYDPQTHTVTCQNNISVQLKGKDKLRAEFPIRTCRSCPKKDKCQLSNSKRIAFHKDHDVARRAIIRQRENEEKKKAAKEKGKKIKSRLIIENVFAYLKKLGGKATSYFNIDRTKTHILLVSTISNMMKTVRICIN
ncbi:MAG: transposase [Nanoarchaeota archaeon]|nr:transposase [Nanoarchaeota archaeon]